jgi:tetratricopeptide (TPR) repeat protein
VRAEEQDRALDICREAKLFSLCAKLKAIRGSRDQNDQLYEASAANFREAERFAELESTDCDRALISMQLGYCAYFQGRPAEGADLLQSAVQVFSQRGELYHQFRCRQLLALTAMDAGQLDVAEKALVGLLDGVRGASFQPMLAPTYNVEGKLAFHQGRFAQALDWFTFGYEEWMERQVPWQVAEQEYWLGRTYLALKDFAHAEEFLRRAGIHWFENNSLTATATTTFAMADLLIQTGLPQVAADILEIAGNSVRLTNSLILASEWAHYNMVASKLNTLGITSSEKTKGGLNSLITAYRSPGNLDFSALA